MPGVQWCSLYLIVSRTALENLINLNEISIGLQLPAISLPSDENHHEECVIGMFVNSAREF